MHSVAHVDWSFAEGPRTNTGTIQGLARSVLVDGALGAVHTELAVASLSPGGWLATHVHAYEEAFYVLAGEMTVEIDGHAWRLVPGDFALIPVGTWHTVANLGDDDARWLAVNTPQRFRPGAERRDTYFDLGRFDRGRLDTAVPLAPGDPTVRYVGHYAGTPPIVEAVQVKDAARGRSPAGMDTALLAYSGIAVKMLVDRSFGADLLTMFTVDYEVGGAAQPHDHPFEETYFFLAGTVEAELDGERCTLHAGDVVFAGVGSLHGFYNLGPDRVRWIETQAPQPPARHSYRWPQHWKRFEELGRR